MANLVVSDITAINNYAGQHYKNILSKIYTPLNVAKDVYVINNLTAKRNLWSYEAFKGLRPVDTSVEDTTAQHGKFAVRTIEPNVVMKLIKVVPEQFRETFLSESLGVYDKDFPQTLAEYIWDAQAEVIGEEIDENAWDGRDPDSAATWDAATAYPSNAYVKMETGVDGLQYFQNTSGAATTAGDKPTVSTKWTVANGKFLAKGLGTILAEDITSGKQTNVVSTGALSASNIMTKVDKDMFRAIPIKIRNKAQASRRPIQFFCAPDVFEMRTDAIRAQKNGGAYLTEDDIFRMASTVVDSNGIATIKPATWMTGSKRVIWTVEKNLTMGVDRLPSSNPFGKFIEGMQSTKGLFKMVLAYQIAMPEQMGCNDQV